MVQPVERRRFDVAGAASIPSLHAREIQDYGNVFVAVEALECTPILAKAAEFFVICLEQLNRSRIAVERCN